MERAKRGKRGSRTGRAARKTELTAGRAPFRWLVRAGFLARGVTYGLIGILALALALGAGTLGDTPNQQGALAAIGSGWLGKVVLVAIAAGLLAYALWKLTQALLGQGPEGGGGRGAKDRVANLSGGLAYLAFFAVAVRVLTGTASDSSKAPRKAAADILSWPGGPVLVGIAGAILVVVSLYQIYEALSGKFADDSKTGQMSRNQRDVFMWMGRLGLTARAGVFAVVGYFVIRTAIDFNPAGAVGLDGALGRLDRQPFGPWIVGLVAAGLLVFAVFSIFEARYRRL